MMTSREQFLAALHGEKPDRPQLAHEILSSDAVAFLINYFSEPAALGVEMNWGSPTQLPIYRSYPGSGDARPALQDRSDEFQCRSGYSLRNNG